MLKVAQQILDYHGFHVYKGAVYGNIHGQLFVYMGERNEHHIHIWMRDKNINKDTTWHKIVIDNTHYRWKDFDCLDVKVDYAKSHKQQAAIKARNEREQLRKELAWVDTLPSDYRYISRSEIKTPNTKGQIYAINGVQYRRLYALKTATAVVKTRNDSKAFEPIPLNKIN